MSGMFGIEVFLRGAMPFAGGLRPFRALNEGIFLAKGDAHRYGITPFQGFDFQSQSIQLIKISSPLLS